MTCAWKVYEDKKIRVASEAYRAHPKYSELVEEASRRGYAPAPLYRLLSDDSGHDLYTWRGGVWIKSEPTRAPKTTQHGQLSLAL